VYNSAGAMLDHFPITVVPDPAYISSNVIIGDVNGDGLPEIIGGTTTGSVFALTAKGEMASGFPLASGGSVAGLAFADVEDTSRAVCGLAASTTNGNLIAWKFGDIGLLGLNRPWREYGHDGSYSNADFSSISGTPLSSDFFPGDRTYNWPNPVYDGKTYIRYFVKTDAQVRIKIFDIAGDLVTSFDGPGVGGVDNEIMWNAGSVQSGVYLAHIEASGAGGSGHAVVKIAVVR